MLNVVVLAGLHERAVEETVASMVRTVPTGTAVLEYDAARLAEGRLRQVLRDAESVLEREVFELTHPCAACAVREAMVPALHRCARLGRHARVLLVLPPSLEPAPAVRLLGETRNGMNNPAPHLQIHSVVTAVDLTRVVDDIDGDDTVAARGHSTAAVDNRCTAEVLVRQIEYADVLSAWLPGPATGTSGEDRAERVAGPDTGLHLLMHLNPGAAVLPVTAGGSVVRGPRRHHPAAARLRDEPGAAFAPLNELSGEVHTVLWQARRPLHPARLRAALDRLIPALLRIRGHVWLASAPQYRYALASSGPRVELGVVGTWLSSPSVWPVGTGAGYLAGAALSWDEEVGDRGNRLVLTGLRLDVAALRTLLDSLVLTDVEYEAGEALWHTFPDPFSDRHQQEAPAR